MGRDSGPEDAPVNELLSYALFYFETATKQHLSDILIGFYAPGEILKAKDTLWESTSNALDPNRVGVSRPLGPCSRIIGRFGCHRANQSRRRSNRPGFCCREFRPHPEGIASA